jgi:hypothetical protein
MRGDVRSDVLKELERRALLGEFRTARHRCDRLASLLANLTRLRSTWRAPAQAGCSRCALEFLAAVKPQCHPGGTCEFDLPDYYFWLNQPGEARVEPAAGWPAAAAVRRDRRSAVAHAQNGRAREEIARGSSSTTFDRDTPCAAAHHATSDAPLFPRSAAAMPLQHALEWQTGDPGRARASRRALQLTCCMSGARQIAADGKRELPGRKRRSGVPSAANAAA